MGADVLDHVMLTKLPQKDGQVVGAAGYNVLDGTFYVIRAAGGDPRSATAATAPPPTPRETYNTWHSPFNTGSQFVLAYEAGADIINMDASSSRPRARPKGFGCAGMNGINSAGAHELNALGERFMGRYHPMMENCPRQFQVGGTTSSRSKATARFLYGNAPHRS